MLLSRLLKPWYVYRPIQLLRRAWFCAWRPSPGYVPIRASWDMPVIADPSKTIGRSILTTGVFDLAVSEALLRLVRPGDTVVDVGANVGYMSMLSALGAGPSGRVYAFEPHPELFGVLQRNLSHARSRRDLAEVVAQRIALGNCVGEADLWIPEDFAANDGVARIGPAMQDGGRSERVTLESIDHQFGDIPISVLKLDVEGYETQVLQGAVGALSRHRIRHVVFEDHSIADSATTGVLLQCGYRIFSLGWNMRGLSVRPVEEAPRLAKPYESPSYIATLDPSEMMARCSARGWMALGNSSLRNRMRRC